MRQAFYNKKIGILLIFTLILSAFQVQSVLASGIIDQKNDIYGPPYTWEYNSVFNGIIGQEFTPRKTNINGIDLFIHNTAGAGEKWVVVTLYKGSLGAYWQGEIATNLYVPDGYSWLHLDFAAPIALEPNALYVMSVWTGYDLMWVFNYANTYSRGRAWVGTRPTSNIDFGFRTYYDPNYNSPPNADAGPDQVVSGIDQEGAYVTLDGSGSSDPNNDPLSYSWSWSGGSSGGEITTVKLPYGTTYVTLEVSDGQFSDSDTVKITVKDSTPPEITIMSITPNILWPPNHKMVNVEIEVMWSDNCDPNPSISVIVTSNESANDDGVGDGNTETDWEILDNTHFRLRAERDGTGNDRIYTITYIVTDAVGNSATASTTITVPHDKKP